MALFEYERQRADLQDKYGQDEATNEYARFLSQQRHQRSREGMTRGFQRNFPKFTGGFASRFGSEVKAGSFRRNLGQFAGDYNRGMGELGADEAGELGQFDAMRAQRAAAYRRAMLMLDEQIAAERAQQNPYQLYM